MPTNRTRQSRVSRGAAATMTVEAYEQASMTAFLAGRNGGDVARHVFGGDKAAAKRFYAANRDQIEARVPPGSRSELWWYVESPEPRSRAMAEELQLYRMGQLQGDELAACKERLRDWHGIEI